MNANMNAMTSKSRTVKQKITAIAAAIAIGFSAISTTGLVSISDKMIVNAATGDVHYDAGTVVMTGGQAATWVSSLTASEQQAEKLGSILATVPATYNTVGTNLTAFDADLTHGSGGFKYIAKGTENVVGDTTTVTWEVKVWPDQTDAASAHALPTTRADAATEWANTLDATVNSGFEKAAPEWVERDDVTWLYMLTFPFYDATDGRIAGGYTANNGYVRSTVLPDAGTGTYYSNSNYTSPIPASGTAPAIRYFNQDYRAAAGNATNTFAGWLTFLNNTYVDVDKRIDGNTFQHLKSGVPDTTTPTFDIIDYADYEWGRKAYPELVRREINAGLTDIKTFKVVDMSVATTIFTDSLPSASYTNGGNETVYEFVGKTGDPATWGIGEYGAEVAGYTALGGIMAPGSRRDASQGLNYITEVAAGTGWSALTNNDGFLDYSFHYEKDDSSQGTAAMSNARAQFAYEFGVSYAATGDVTRYTGTFQADVNSSTPTITGTVASNPTDATSKNIEGKASTTIKDTVSYSGLDTTKTYVLHTSVVDKTASTALNPVVVAESDTILNATVAVGTKDVTVTFDARNYIGKQLVIFEELLLGNTVIHAHKNLDDANQTVSIVQPVLNNAITGTVATNATTAGSKNVTSIAAAKIKDVISYTGLTVGHPYVLTTSVVDKTSPTTVIGTQTTSFVATAAGTTETTITVDLTAYAGKQVVVYETIKDGEDVVGQHTDVNDADQTVSVVATIVPAITGTVATNPTDGTKNVVTGTTSKIKDVISYENLEASKAYTLVTSVVDATNANTVLATATTSFIAMAATGTTETTITVDTSAYVGKNVVVFEVIKDNGVEIATHKDINDAQQTVAIVAAPVVPVPAITGTVATNPTDGTKNVVTGTTSKIKDVISYENLEANKAYTLVTSVVDATNANTVLATATTSFIATAATGTTETTITVDTSAYVGKNVVVFEVIKDNGVEVAIHKDVNDAQQTVAIVAAPVVPVPAITGTVATNPTDGTKNVVTGTTSKIKDVISYENLEASKAYTLVTSVVDATNANTVLATATTSFIATAATGTTETTITVDTSAYVGKNVVVFEVIKDNGVEVATHKDINDAQQTVAIVAAPVVPVPAITGTVATNPSNATKSVEAGTTSKIKDVISYENLEASKAYTLVTSVVDATSANTVLATATTSFIATAATGTTETTITVDTSAYAGKNVVVFEVIKDNGVEIATHKDINDAQQTIAVTAPVIVIADITKTVAKNTNDNTSVVPASTTAKITDTIYYQGLTAGNTYYITTRVVDKTTGTFIYTSANRTAFVATAAGQTTVNVDVDTSAYAGKNIVVFEYIYDGAGAAAVLVASHEDINDALQTVTVKAGTDNAITSTVATGNYNGGYYDNNPYYYNYGYMYDYSFYSHYVSASTSATITDRVYYDGLIDGESYVVTPTVYDARTGMITPIMTAPFTFVANSRRGYVDVNIKFDATSYAGRALVVFESITHYDVATRRSVEVGWHRDLTDIDQTVYVVNGTTTSANITMTVATGSDKTHNLEYSAYATITDRIYYTGLTSGTTYTVQTSVIDSATRSTIATRSTTFVANSTGYVDITVNLDSTPYAGRSLVLYESIFTGLTELCYHKDINDLSQTVKVNNAPGNPTGPDPVVTTSTTTSTVIIDIPDDGNPTNDSVAIDSINKSHTMTFSANANILHKVRYQGLQNGLNYTLVSTVYDKSTGVQVLPTAYKSFTADSKQYVETLIPFDSTLYPGQSFVVFAAIEYNGKEVSAYRNINDPEATVTVATVATVLTADNRTSKTVSASTYATLIDTVRYTGLTPGRTYRITGHILNKEENAGKVFNSQDLIIMGQEGSLVTNGVKTVSTSVVEFTPTTASGSLEVAFNLDVTKYAGQHLVAFEIIADKEYSTIVGEHKDVNDANQTVVIKTSTNVYTGGEDLTMMFAIGSGICVLSAVGLGGFAVRRKRKANK